VLGVFLEGRVYSAVDEPWISGGKRLHYGFQKSRAELFVISPNVEGTITSRATFTNTGIFECPSNRNPETRRPGG
jgi:hypothetical protein